MKHYSKTIVGAGPVGLALALNLAKQQIETLVIDPFVTNSDARILALSYYSYNYLSTICDLSQVTKTPIKQVNISHSGFGFADILAAELDISELGATIAYSDLILELRRSARDNPHITLLSATVQEIESLANYSLIEYMDDNGDTTQITSEMLFIAEGGSLAKFNFKQDNYDYGCDAIIAQVKFSQIKPNTAYERFTTKGPLVIMPYMQHHVAVWSIERDLSLQYQQNSNLLIEDLTHEFTERFGDISLLNQISSYPLRLNFVSNKVFNNVVVIGNAAQMLHPVSAQGLNLGLRDARDLSKIIISNSKLSEFNNMRKNDSFSVVGFTHLLAKYLDNNSCLYSLAKSIGLPIFQNQTKIRKHVAEFLIYGI